MGDRLRGRLTVSISTNEDPYLTQGFECRFGPIGRAITPCPILRCGGLEQSRQICEPALCHGVVPSHHNFSSGVGRDASFDVRIAGDGIAGVRSDRRFTKYCSSSDRSVCTRGTHFSSISLQAADDLYPAPGHRNASGKILQFARKAGSA